MVSWVKDHDFVNEFLFAAPTPATYTEKSFPGDMFWLVSKHSFIRKRKPVEANNVSKPHVKKWQQPVPPSSAVIGRKYVGASCIANTAYGILWPRFWQALSGKHVF
jgi:hypothetical protein